jgi:hypothetical protein
MTLQQRIDDLNHLGDFIKSDAKEWKEVKDRAYRSNHWFTEEFIELASSNIASEFLQKEKLQHWAKQYNLPEENVQPKLVGLVMAGNIPLVGFHDMLCIFISGHKQLIKASSKDEILIKFLVDKLIEIDSDIKEYISFADKLNGCDAYIATGSNNTSRYFEYYFGKYPNIIRRNRTSVAVLDGDETEEELDRLADDIQIYFGLGCRNVTKMYVPQGYNFEPLLRALDKYDHYCDFHKYRHNYDYQLALLMMSNRMYMTNDSIIFSENPSLFSAVSQVHYEHYDDEESLKHQLENNDSIQVIVGKNYLPFGDAQRPSLTDYADGVDTMKFLVAL